MGLRPPPYPANPSAEERDAYRAAVVRMLNRHPMEPMILETGELRRSIPDAPPPPPPEQDTGWPPPRESLLWRLDAMLDRQLVGGTLCLALYFLGTALGWWPW